MVRLSFLDDLDLSGKGVTTGNVDRKRPENLDAYIRGKEMVGRFDHNERPAVCRADDSRHGVEPVAKQGRGDEV